MEKERVANITLAKELKKRFKFIEKAHEQILVGNYGIAKKLLGKVLYEPLEIKVVDITEEANETAE